MKAEYCGTLKINFNLCGKNADDVIEKIIRDLPDYMGLEDYSFDEQSYFDETASDEYRLQERS